MIDARKPTGSEAEKRCRRHVWIEWDRMTYAEMWEVEARAVNGISSGDIACRMCYRLKDEARSTRGRTSRNRGNRAELTVARRLDGTKVGPLGKPWDVETGSMRLQVKKLARWPSVTAVLGWIDAIPFSPLMRGVVLIEPGQQPRKLIVLDFEDFASWYGDPTKEAKP